MKVGQIYSAYLAGLFHDSGHSKMTSESLHGYPSTTQQQDGHLIRLSSKQTYSTLFTLPATGTVTTTYDKDKDLAPLYYVASIHSFQVPFLIKKNSLHRHKNFTCRFERFCAVE